MALNTQICFFTSF